MQKRFNSALALCGMNTCVQAPDVTTHKEILNPTVRSARTDLYTQSDPTSFQTDLSTTHLVSISRDHCLSYISLLLLLHIIGSICFLFLGSLSKDPYTNSCFQNSPLHSLLIPYISYCKPEEKRVSFFISATILRLYFKKTDSSLY